MSRRRSYAKGWDYSKWKRTGMRRKPAIAIAKANRRKINRAHEDKYITNGTQLFNPLAAGTIFNLSQVVTGDTNITRIGEKIYANRLQVTVQLHSAEAASVIRIILFKDKLQHGANPTVAQLLASVNDSAFQNHSNIERFKFLRDIEVPSTIHLFSNDTSVYRFDVKLNHIIHYIGNTAAEGSNGSGSLYMCIITHANGTADISTWTSRVTFSD